MGLPNPFAVQDLAFKYAFGDKDPDKMSDEELKKDFDDIHDWSGVMANITDPLGIKKWWKDFVNNLKIAGIVILASIIGLTILYLFLKYYHKSPEPARPMGNPVSPLGAPPEVVNVVAPGTFPRESRLKT